MEPTMGQKDAARTFPTHLRPFTSPQTTQYCSAPVSNTSGAAVRAGDVLWPTRLREGCPGWNPRGRVVVLKGDLIHTRI
jgi:hypothetical protein